MCGEAKSKLPFALALGIHLANRFEQFRLHTDSAHSENEYVPFLAHNHFGKMMAMS